jgi:leader peptidase (prepilin peptidase)/N-methyltransferase
MGLHVLLLTGLATGLAAGILTPWIRRVANSESAWFASRTHVILAVLGGAGAGALAEGRAELVGFALLALACALLVAIDLAVYRLPDIITGPMYPILLVALTVQAAVDGDWSRLGRAAAGGAVLAVGYLVLALLVPSGLGLGDVKLAGLLGVFLGWTGWPNVFVGTLAAFALNALVAVVLLVSRRVTRKGATAFGPWMVAGAAIGALWVPP